MTLLYQRTIKNIVKTSGIGLHSGKLTNITLRPLDVNSGIIFRKIHHDSSFVDINASNKNTINSELSTTIEKDGHTIKMSKYQILTIIVMSEARFYRRRFFARNAPFCGVFF